MSGLYASDGSINVTVVSGASAVGAYAADGSLNVIKRTNEIGVYHSSGARLVTPVTSTNNGSQASDGSLFVSQTPYYVTSQRVTVVSGSLNPIGGSHPTYYIYGF